MGKKPSNYPYTIYLRDLQLEGTVHIHLHVQTISMYNPLV